MNIHEYWYLYRSCLDTLPSNGQKWIHKEREKTEEVRFIYKTIICFETTTNKFERLLQNLMENIKDAGMSDKWVWTKYSSSHRRCSVRKGVLRNFPKFTGKHLCQSLFLNKVAALRPATLLKKILWHRCFPVNFVKFL